MDREILDFTYRTNELSSYTLLKNVPKNDKYFLVQWLIMSECNYNCSYCFGHSGMDNILFTSLDKLKHAVDLIFSLNKKNYIIELIGGEITFHPNLIELIDYIQNYNKSVFLHLVSNGSKNIDYFDKLLSSIKIPAEFKISIHIEYSNIEHIKQLIMTFNKHNININIALMAHPMMKDKTIYFFNELFNFRKEYIFDLYIGIIREGENFVHIDSRYDKDFLDWITNSRILWNNSLLDCPKESYEYFSSMIQPLYNIEHNINKNNMNIEISYGDGITTQYRNFKDFYCCSGVNLLYILPDGNYKGTACSIGKYIGNIYYDDSIDILELSNIIKCPIDLCGCDLNDNIHKFRMLEEAEQYMKKIIDNNIFYILKYINNKFNFIINDIETKYNKIDINLKRLDNNIDNSIIILNNLINKLVWWIPFKRLRDSFRNKISNTKRD